MPDLNPYESPKTSPESIPTEPISRSRQLWRGYLIASAAAPILLAILVLVLSFLGRNGNETALSFMMPPLVVGSIGLFFSYVAMLIIGMPLIFFLDRRHTLNGLSIHLASLVGAFLLAMLTMLGASGMQYFSGVRTDPVEWLWALGGMTLFYGIPALITGTAFWISALKWGHQASPLQDPIRPTPTH